VAVDASGDRAGDTLKVRLKGRDRDAMALVVITMTRTRILLYLTIAVVGLLLLGYFSYTIYRSEHWGEVAGALGGFIGGMVGAGGAVLAVYLTLSRQRREETSNVTSAVQTEVASLVKYINGAIEVCADVKKGTRQIPRADAVYIVKNLVVDPVVYPAIADRVGLLPHPQATAAFYMRISEAKATAEVFAKATGTPETHVTPDLARTVTDILVTALQLADPIVAGVPPHADLAAGVQVDILAQIQQGLSAARAAFPEAESFQPPAG
jgi:hypothetical protein